MSEESKLLGRYRNALELADNSQYPTDARVAVSACMDVIKEVAKASPIDRSESQSILGDRRWLQNFPDSIVSCTASAQKFAQQYGLGLHFEVEKDGRVSFFAVKHLVAIRECDCHCHKFGGIHFYPCCAGTCPNCKKGFASGFEDHKEMCIG
jgi:hypothetical protein